MDRINLMTLIKEFCKWCFSREPYTYRLINGEKHYTNLFGTMSRFFLYFMLIWDIIHDKKALAIWLLFSGLFCSFLNFFNFMDNFIRNYRIDLFHEFKNMFLGEDKNGES